MAQFEARGTSVLFSSQNPKAGPIFRLQQFLSAAQQREIFGVMPHMEPQAASSSGHRVDLGLERVGFPLPHMPFGPVLDAARRAFAVAAAAVAGSDYAASTVPLHRLADAAASHLTAQAILYSPSASMAPHTDAPLGADGLKWIVILSLGLAADFSVDGAALRLAPGDALVMDAAAVMHGVDRIVPGSAPLGLTPGLLTPGGLGDAPAPAIPDARLSILLWEAAAPFLSAPVPAALDGFAGLFGGSGSDDSEPDDYGGDGGDGDGGAGRGDGPV